MLRFKIVLVGFLVGWSLSAERYYFHHYDGDEGLSYIVCKTMVQDRSGFVWVGTHAGLNRYNGNDFDIFSVRDGLVSDYITTLDTDPYGRLWVGTALGLGLIENGVVTRFYRKSSGIRLLAFHRGDLWYGTEDSLFRLGNPGAGDWEPEAIPGMTRPQCLFKDSGGGLWVGNGQGLFRLTEESWRRVWSASENEPIVALQENPEGRLIAVTEGGLSEFDGERLNLFYRVSEVRDIQCFLIDSYGTYWLGTSWGLWKWDGKKDRGFAEVDGLPFKVTYTLMQDHEGLLWIGGLGGLATLNGRAFTIYGEKDGLPSAKTGPIFKDGQGFVWVGTEAGPARFGSGRWERFENQDRTLASTLVFQNESADKFWMGSENGLYYFRDNRFHALPYFEGEEVTSLGRGPDGVLWVAVTGKGIFKGDGSSFEKVAVPNQTFANPTFYVGPRGDVYVSGDKGLSHFDGTAWKTFTVDDGLAHANPYFICGNGRGDIWFGYSAPVGFTHYDGKAFTTYTTREGLANDTVYSLGLDRDERLWVGTARGIDRFDSDGFTHYGLNEGLPGHESSVSGFFRDGDGTLWFGTPQGIAHYDPGLDMTAGTQVKTIVQARLGELALNAGQSVKVGHGDNELNAKVNLVSVIDRKHLEARFRIKGYQDEWQDLAGSSVPMAKLPPGRFSLEVQARKYQRPWSSSEAIEFKILPPIWQTPWFYLVLSSIAAGLVTGLIHLRTRALSNQKARLEALVASKTEDLTRANESLKLLSLTDPLTGLHNRRFFREQIGILMAATQRLQANTFGESGNRNVHLTFFLIDLDHFKSINDTHGHDCGDLVLKSAAKFLSGCIRESDLLVRWGGEEFLIAAQHTNPANAKDFAERIRKGLESLTIDLGRERELSATCSIGFVSFPFAEGITPGLTWEHLLQTADLALYSAKDSGRNTWVGVKAGKMSLSSQEIEKVCEDLGKGQELGLVSLEFPAKPRPANQESVLVWSKQDLPEKPAGSASADTGRTLFGNKAITPALPFVMKSDYPS